MSSQETDQAALDTADLERFGYKQELSRSLNTFSSFAVAFSYISPSTGIFTLFYLGLLAVGGWLFWTWPIVAVGQMFVALNFAELSSHFPVAGSVFQWTKYLSTRTYAWFTGWIYLFAGVITVAAVVATVPIALLPMLNQMFGWSLNTALGSTDQLVVSVVTLVIITVLNIYGVKLVSIINNTGVVFEILGMVVFALIMALLHNNQGVGSLFDAGSSKITASNFLVGMFMSLFVIYGFDTAGTLAEETKNPRAESPKAILGSIGGAFVIGAIFLIGTLMAIPSLADAQANFFGPAQVIGAVFSSWVANLYLLIVVAAVFVCCLSIMTSTVRLAFGMARDNQLPFSGWLSKVNPRLHTPIGACIGVAVLAAIPFLQFTGATVIAVAATAMIYISYFLGNIAVLRARSKGWPRVAAPFKLGSWGKVVNILALLWGGAMILNLMWWTNDPASLRILTNPTAKQSDYGFGQLVNFHVSFLNSIPLMELVIGAVIAVGVVYYALVGRTKEFSTAVPPAEDLAGIAPAAAT
ncbi:MAG: APC family permease [Actinomycetota bacterium]